MAAPIPNRLPAARPPRKRASYREGVAWLALNDEPTQRDPEEVAGLVATALLADLFGYEPEKVALDVIRFREAEDRARG